jgi:RHS repeat-associated protein
VRKLLSLRVYAGGIGLCQYYPDRQRLKEQVPLWWKEQDSKTGFFEYHYRQYDSWLGRWHVVDPMAEMYGTQSPYHFAGNNPINNMETNGAFWQEAVADGIERDIDEWGNVASGGTGTRTTYRGPTTFFGSGGYYGNYSAGGNYLGSTFTGTFGGSTYTRMNMGRGFPEYTYNGGYYRDGNGNIVDWSEVDASLDENGALLDPSADNFAEQGFTGYVTSVNNEIVKLYVDGVGEFDFSTLSGNIEQQFRTLVYNQKYTEASILLINHYSLDEDVKGLYQLRINDNPITRGKHMATTGKGFDGKLLVTINTGTLKSLDFGGIVRSVDHEFYHVYQRAILKMTNQDEREFLAYYRGAFNEKLPIAGSQYVKSMCETALSYYSNLSPLRQIIYLPKALELRNYLSKN